MIGTYACLHTGVCMYVGGSVLAENMEFPVHMLCKISTCISNTMGKDFNFVVMYSFRFEF